jgi:hypothetical protein
MQCEDLVGRSVSGITNYNCCDGDPGLPCLVKGAEAYLTKIKISK